MLQSQHKHVHGALESDGQRDHIVKDVGDEGSGDVVDKCPGGEPTSRPLQMWSLGKELYWIRWTTYNTYSLLLASVMYGVREWVIRICI